MALDDLVYLHELIVNLVTGDLIFCRNNKQLVVIAYKGALKH